MKNTIILTGTIFLVIVIAVASIWYISKNQKLNTNNNANINTPNVNNSDKSDNPDGYKLTYEYLGNNSWTYNVSGTLPTPCNDVTIDALVMESYPEQVNINVKKVVSTSDTVCIQIIKEFSKDGTFNASEKAQVKLNVLE